MTYDSALRDLQESIQDEVVCLLTDSESIVKRSLLTDMPRLCIFFGRRKTIDILLSHMITYLNDVDWMLRRLDLAIWVCETYSFPYTLFPSFYSSFFDSIVGIATFVGSRSLEEYILPLMMQSLTDFEEFVVEKVLRALTSLAELRLIMKIKLKELVSNILPLLYHPNPWIRAGVW